MIVGNVVRFRLRHARASSKGYKSGLSSWRDTPVSRSIDKTNSAGTPFLDEVSQYQTCDCVVPMRFAKGDCPPARSQALLSASVDAVMTAPYPNLGKVQPKNLWMNNYRNLGSSGPMKKVDAGAFGRRVRERREELGWSQPRLAKESGFSQTHVGWVEDGKPKNPRRQALQLAEALQVHADWLLYETGPRETGPVLPSPDEFSVIYAALSFEGRQAVLATAEKHLPKKKQSA